MGKEVNDNERIRARPLINPAPDDEDLMKEEYLPQACVESSQKLLLGNGLWKDGELHTRFLCHIVF